MIRVIAQEGEEIVTRYDLPINGKGEVVNVMPEMVEMLKINGIKYSLLPNEVSIGRKKFELKRAVPHFPRLGEVDGDSFAQKVAMLDWDADLEARERIDYAASPPRPVEPETSEPVRRGPGRPRKVLDEASS